MNEDLGEVGAKVTLNDKQYVEVIDGLEKKTKAAFDRIAKIAAGLFGLNALRSFVNDSVQAFIKQENAVNMLDRSLRRLGEGKASKRLQEFAKEMQKVTTYGDETTLAVMKMGLSMGVSADKMEEATKAAMGLAAGFEGKINLETAMQLIGKAANGNTAMLARYGIKLDETKTKQEQFNELLQKGGDLFQLAKAETFGQRLIQLGNAWGDLKEQIGEFVLVLTGFYDSVDSSRNIIENLTDTVRDNLDQWAFEIRYVWEYFKAGIKSVGAMVEPVFTYLVELGQDAAENIVRIGEWAFENIYKVWTNLPDIMFGILKDILNYYKNFGMMIVDLFKNVGVAIWKALRYGDTEGFKSIWDDLKADAIKTVSEIGDETQAALNRAGVSAFPDLQSNASMEKVIDKYAHLGDTFEKIDRQRIENQAQLESDLIDRLNKKRSDNEAGTKAALDAAAEAGKSDVAGSFSAAMLNAMLGANSPEKETAKNTKQMVEQQKETNQKLADSGLVYT